MRALVRGQVARLTPKNLIGQGGEACVYKWRGSAIKVYHPQSDHALDAHFSKLSEFPKNLPPRVLGPTSIVTDDKHRRIGFEMNLVSGVEDFKRLSQRKWRMQNLDVARVLALFRELYDLLDAVHAAQVVVGDLNDSNVVFNDDGAWLIDSDSMQFGRHMCTVAHERFLDPKLFGVDLTKRQAFDTSTDWYAFAVLLFSSLLYVHPFGGVHPDYPTLARRAEAGHSILRPDVVQPKSANHWELLSDAMLDWFHSVFEGGARTRPNRDLLAGRWTRCPHCGLDHARPSCPSCARTGVHSPRPITVQSGRVRAIPIHQTSGSILFSCMQGGLRYLTYDKGEVRRENGQLVMRDDQLFSQKIRFGISAQSTWVGRGDTMVEVRRERIVQKLSTGTCRDFSAFATNASGCVRTNEDWMIDVASGRRLGRVLEGQTQIWLGDSFGYGMYRAGKVSVQFLFDPRSGGTTRIDLPPIEGRLVGLRPTFGGAHVLVGVATELNGRTEHRLYLVDQTGQCVAERAGRPEDSPALARLSGKAVFGGRVLTATDAGLMTLQVDKHSKQLVDGELFEETEPFIDADCEIFAGPSGSVYVVSKGEITQLVLG